MHVLLRFKNVYVHAYVYGVLAGSGSGWLASSNTNDEHTHVSKPAYAREHLNFSVGDVTGPAS
jgi:hypothetical protein